METVGEALRHYDTSMCHSSSKKRDFRELLAHVLEVEYSALYHSYDLLLSKSQKSSIQKFADRLNQGEPISRILGFVDFFGARIEISKDTLSPRPETELLVERAIQRSNDRKLNTVIDLCTGSGCIAIAFKMHSPNSQVIGSDLSEKALMKARQNADLNGVKVEFMKSDLLAQYDKNLKADLIFCNPPYISQDEYSLLDANVKRFDPKEALVSGEDGLDHYRRLAAQLPDYASKGALICLEIGWKQKKEVIKIFNTPLYRNLLCETDYAGHDRFIFLEVH